MANFTIKSNKKSINPIHFRTTKAFSIPIPTLFREPLNKISKPNHVLELYSGSVIVQNDPINNSIEVSSIYNSKFFIPNKYRKFGITNFNQHTIYYQNILKLENKILGLI